ncbi:intra-flagellar transport protein 57 [Fimicolochytrium jonesii]|uniref:intra-flagellar transport protein 57 n=1 Tax=Fimicolochytrium jonesii TaxID=1396493 RepID=UPI0022FF2FC4|nr:intra-flagellar transport protein 57 [Fimicolochytrium jonesii]KAI8824209.1 intra-flagellar transport protein 57 [Fimicolochytrium jonesii]
MDDVLDKLRILNYQRDFCKTMNFKPLHRFYFTVPASNPNEQFYCFTSLSAWLVKLNGNSFDPPGQFDDPNATVANMAAKLKEMEISADVGLNKLRQGHGDGVLIVLQALVDGALAKSGFTFQKPTHKVDEYAEEAEVDADAELTAESIEETIPADDDAEDMFMGTMAASAGVRAGTAKAESAGLRPTTARPTVDPAEWRLEVERVTPMLRVQIANDNKDWRIHVENMRHHHKTITSTLTETQSRLGKLHSEIERTLEKISSREKYINTQFEAQAEQHRVLQDQGSEIKQKYSVASSHVSDLTIDLSRISEELDSVKGQMDDIGSGMTDSKPLLSIKQGVTKLKSEIKQMDLRIGVIQHMLLQAKLKTKGPMVEPPNMMQVSSRLNGLSLSL